MIFIRRNLLYEAKKSDQYVDYGEVTHIISPTQINVNIGGQRDVSGNLIILESVAIVGNYVPRIGDWVGIEWRNGMPVAVGGSNAVSSGLVNINDQVKIISTNEVANGVINSDHIRANAITAIHIKAGDITADHIRGNTITGDKIKAGEISGNHIAAGSIDATRIAAGTITGDRISGGTITGTQIQAGTISGNHIMAGSITTQHISANSITSALVSANTITGDKIVANQISGNHIVGSSITGDKIAANSISGNHIVAGSIDADKLTVSSREQGLFGQYFSGNNFNQYKGSRIDPTINFDWASGSPNLVGVSDNFSIRWEGFFFAPQDGQYTFYTTADDVVRVWIDNVLVIDGWVYQAAERSGIITLTKNTWYSIRVDYSENTGNASLVFKWQPPSGVKELIPAKYLSPSHTIIDGATILTGTITASQIKVGTITAQSGIIADASIGTAHIISGSITSAKIGNAEIKTAHIATGNITNALIKDADIQNAKIANLDAGKITTGYLNASRIQAGTISGNHIAANTISGNHITANSIDAGHLKAGAITASKIAAGTITSDKIQAGSITGDVIRAGSIEAYHISTVGLDAQLVNVYNSETGETLIGGGYLRVDGLDVGVVQSDNLLANGLFLTASSSYGYKRDNQTGEAILGDKSKMPGAHQVWKVDLTTGTKVTAIDIAGKKPAGIAMDEDGTFAYVTVQGDDTMVQLDLVNDVITQKVKNMGSGPGVIGYTGDKLADHKHFFVLNTDAHDHNIPDSLMVIDAPPHSVGADLYVHHTIPLGNNPYDFVIDSDSITYITMADQGDIVVVDTSSKESMKWKVAGRIPIAAFGTDNYHGGLPGNFGLSEVVGGDAASQYDKGAGSMGGMDMGGMTHTHGGYGSTDGSMKKYVPRGIALSADNDTLYVADHENGELLVVDKRGAAPYNSLTGHPSSSISPAGGSGNAVSMPGMPMPPSTDPNAIPYWEGGPPTSYVRYRIPIGNAPEFVEVVNGKIFVTLSGSGEVAVIDESVILSEIQADRQYYKDWTVYMQMRQLPTFAVRRIYVGSKPVEMTVNTATQEIYVSVSGQNQIAVVGVAAETVARTFNVGVNPKASAVTKDGKYLYVVHFGGSGDLSFVYPKGNYIGDAYLGLEGGVEYQGAEYWLPDRSDWAYDASGNVTAMSTVEFRINEPFLNEGGYVRLSAVGNTYQYAQIEQDIYNVTNYSNGDNIILTQKERLRSGSGNTIFYPKNEWLSSPAPSNIQIVQAVSGGQIITNPTASQYTLYYGANARIEFSGNVVPSGGWVQLDYTAKNNIYFKPHNSSVLIAVENGSSPNFATAFEVDEFVPKFVAVDNQQTSKFTPTQDGISQEYTGLEYSLTTNRALGKTVTSSLAPLSGNIAIITNGIERADDYVTMPVGLQSVTIDLGKKYMVGQLNVCHMYDSTRKYKETKTQVSADGTTWITVYDSAINGIYPEKAFHSAHNHWHFGKPIFFDAQPVRYIRDYANGWIEEDGLSSGAQNHWAEIKAYADWEVEEGYTFPQGAEKAGQQIATNGKCIVSTDISGAYIAMDIAIEFTSWWYMTYAVGPQFGQLDIEMPTAMNTSHSLFQEAPYLNKVAHRHIMPFAPSQNIKADDMNNIKRGKHRVVIRQKSGRVTLDRLRFEDYQYNMRSSTSIPSRSSSTNFKRYKIVAEQSKWYQGTGIQSTEGAYDEQRKNPDTGVVDKSVPLKYRVRVRTDLNANGTTEERGIAYMTSAIMETGKLSSHWRPSAASDSYPASKVEFWNPSQPHKTGIQSHHLANGAVRGAKILPGAVMDYHVSSYARISEHKLGLKYPTHGHDNKSILDSINGWAGISGNYGTGNVLARGDHQHDYLPLTGGSIQGSITANAQSKFSNGTFVDPQVGTNYGLKVSQGIAADKLYITGDVTILGKVDSVDVSNLSASFATVSGNVTAHIGSGGSAHPIANGTTHGFMSSSDFTKLAAVAPSANNYVHPSGDGNLHVPVTSTTNNNKVLKAGSTAASIAWGSVDWGELVNKPATFAPPIATSSVLGGVKQGSNVTIAGDGTISVTAPYVHPTGDGNLHVPATSTTNNGKFLKAGATAGSISWVGVDWSDIASKPVSTVANIDDAVTKRHSQNTDTGTTSTTFAINSGAASTTAAGLIFGNAAKAYLRWSGTGLEAYSDFSAATPVWSEVKALTFRKSDGTEVSYQGHTHLWADLTNKPTTFTPPISTGTLLGGVMVGGSSGLVLDAAGNLSHPTGDGNLHVPATSTTSNKKVLIAGATAGSLSWNFVDWTDVANKPATFTPPIATSSVLGGVKQGSNVTIDGTGVLSVAAPYSHPTGDGNLHVPATSTTNNKKVLMAGSTAGTLSWANVDWVDLINKPATFTPPIATSSVLGGVKQGTNISIDASGVISSTYSYTHPSGDGNLHVPATSTTNSNKVLKAGSAAGSLSWGNVGWSELTGVPATFTPSAHTHTVSQITDITSTYYDKTTSDGRYAQLAAANSLTQTLTLTNPGLALKVQPSGTVTANTKIVQVVDSTGKDLFTIDAEGDINIAGNFVVTGTTTTSGTQTVTGDYSVSGNLSVGGNATLGDALTDLATVKGDLRVEGTIKQAGKYVEVHRRPLYGIAGDLQFQTDSTTFDTIVDNVYTPTGYALPAVASGATRYYRIYLVYSDDITSTQVTAGQKITLRLAGSTNKDIDVTTTGGTPNGRRDFYSPYFTDIPAGHWTLQAQLLQAGNALGIGWIELAAYDYYA